MCSTLPPHRNQHCCGGDPAALIPTGHPIKLLISSNMMPDLKWILKECPHIACAEHLIMLVRAVRAICRGAEVLSSAVRGVGNAVECC